MDIRVRASKDPQHTNIIDTTYNQMEYADVKMPKFRDDNNEHFSLLEQSNKMMNNKTFEQKISNEKNDSYENQFKTMTFDNPSKEVAYNDVPLNTDDTRRLETERNLALANGWTVFSSGNQMDYKSYR